MRDVVLFGVGTGGQTVYGYLARDPRYRVVGFTVDEAFLPEERRCLGLPVVPFPAVAQVFPPSDCRMMVAVGFQEMNTVREAICHRARGLGYRLESYVDPRASVFDSVRIGDNCLVLEHTVLQPDVRIGDGTCIGTGVLVAHQTEVGPYCWLAPGCVLGGNSVVGARTFVGIRACIGHNIRMGRENFLGAAAVVTQDTDDGAVFVVPNTPRHRLGSRQFIKRVHFT